MESEAQIVVGDGFLLDVNRVPVAVLDVAGLRGERGLAGRRGTVTAGESEHADERRWN
jgi:hypothetical protein